MTGSMPLRPSSSMVPHQYIAQDSVAPRGLSIAQQREIAVAQAQAASLDRPYRPTTKPFSGSASLYVGELDPQVHEKTLYEIFSAVGPVESVRVCRDAITRRSLGYAFVNFKEQVDGERALQALNSTLILGKRCRIMWSQRDLAKRKMSGGNIFVRNLDPSVTTKALHDTFAQYGSILSCKVVTDMHGQSKGYGFVHYDTMEAAENAIQHVNGKMLYDRELFVGHHIPKRERQQQQQQQRTEDKQQQQQKFTNVYVKNLMPDIKEEELKELFGGFGPIVSVMIQRDENGNSKGFGFVNFERHEDAEKAVSQMNDTEYIGRRLLVSRALKKSEREDDAIRRQQQQDYYQPRYQQQQQVQSLQHPSHPLHQTKQQQQQQQQQYYMHPSPHYPQSHDSRIENKHNRYQGNLYIRNLDDEVDDQRLREEFSKFGVITSAKVMRDDKGQSKGFGFVCFSSVQEANKAVAEMNGRMIASKSIYVAPAQRREDRRHIADMAQRSNNQLHLQQPFMPMPVNGYIPGPPVYYDYTNTAAVYPQPEMVPSAAAAAAGRPSRASWSHAPTPYMKHGYHIATGPVPAAAYINYLPPNAAPTRPIYQPVVDSNNNRSATGMVPSNAEDQVSQAQSAKNQEEQASNEQQQKEEEAVAFESKPEEEQPLTLEMLADYSPEMQNQLLGERIYAVVHPKYPQLAGKVTGMLLEMDKEDLVPLINERDALESKADEAVAVLEQHRAATSSQSDELTN